MCLIVFRFLDHPVYRLVLAANRDEYYARPTAPAHFWDDYPYILAGRDLEQMGTWLGITRDGRLAALTNYRNPADHRTGGRSRGEIAAGFLKGDAPADAYLNALSARGDDYRGFNAVAGDLTGLWYYSNYQGRVTAVPPGVHGLSNHLLNTPWPKVDKACLGLKTYLDGCEKVNADDLFYLLADAERPPDEYLPHTGVSLDWERDLSPVFIRTADYGTRSSTVLTIDWDGEITFTEQTFDSGESREKRVFRFQAP